MKKNFFRKSLVYATIILFVGTIMAPGIIGINEKNKDTLQNHKQDPVLPPGARIPLNFRRNIDARALNENIVMNHESVFSSFDEPEWEWAVSAGGTSYDAGYGICADNSGNTYVTGYFVGTAMFGSTMLTSNGGQDVFVAKLNSSGVWQWAKSAGGTGWDYGFGIRIDSNNNIYVSGSFEGTATFGSINITSQGGSDVFVAKLNSNGEWQWAESAGGTSYDAAFGIFIDTNNNIHVTGYFRETAMFGATNITSVGYDDVFVAKLNSNGEWQWAESAGGTGYDYGYGISMDTNNNIYVTGGFRGTATFGTTNLTSNGYEDIFVAKLNSNGVWQWAESAGGTDWDIAIGICVDPTNNIYVTGYFEGTATFGTTNLTSVGYDDVFVAKLNSNGEWQWAVQSTVGVNDLAIGVGICVDFNGNTYITGFFMGEVSFGSINLTSSGAENVFVAKLNSNGEWQWAVQNTEGENGAGIGYHICRDNIGDMYVTGLFEGEIIFGSATISSSGESDVFVAKLGSDIQNQPPITPTIEGPTKGKVGKEYTYCISAVLDPDGDQIYVYWDWGDGTNSGWVGPYSSGEQVCASNSWDTKGTYTIKAKLKDTYGAESDWGYLEVSIPRTRSLFLNSILNRFPNMFLILRYLIRQY